jgi:hypothetical protein
MIHAAAFATMNHGLLRYIGSGAGVLYEAVLLTAVLALMRAVHYANARSRRHRFDSEALRIVSFGSAGLLVLVVSTVLIGLTHVFWPDFLWITAGLVLHPYLSDVTGVMWTGMKRFFRASVRI